MNIDFVNAVLVQTIASLVGVFCGALAALAIDRHNNRQRHRRRERTLLRNQTQELTENNHRPFWALDATKPPPPPDGGTDTGTSDAAEAKH